MPRRSIAVPRSSAPRVVIIFGASSGIGVAAAAECAARGDHLVLSSRSGAALNAAAERCRAAGAASVSVETADVRENTAVRNVVTNAVAAHGRLDAVLQAAGVVAYGRFEEIPAEVYDGVLATNVGGASNVARATMPVLRAQQSGHLILIGSILGYIAVPTMTPYVVSKYAIRSLGRQLALENRDLPDVHVTVVSPGSTDTPIYRQAASYLGVRSRPPFPVDSARKVALASLSVLERPRDRVSVGPANTAMRAGFSLLPALFDRLVGPLFAIGGLTGDALGPTAGNVLEPAAHLEGERGGAGQGIASIRRQLRRLPHPRGR